VVTGAAPTLTSHHRAPFMGDPVRMALVLAFPFTVAADGGAAVVGQGSDRHIEQSLAHLIQTEVGERFMCWPFGVAQPAWAKVIAADIQAGVDAYSHPVEITDVIVTKRADLRSDVRVGWQRPSGQL